MKKAEFFPPEILTFIGEKLSLTDLVSASLVCRQWHSILDPVLKKQLVYGYLCTKLGISNSNINKYNDLYFKEIVASLKINNIIFQELKDAQAYIRKDALLCIYKISVPGMVTSKKDKELIIKNYKLQTENIVGMFFHPLKFKDSFQANPLFNEDTIKHNWQTSLNHEAQETKAPGMIS